MKFPVMKALGATVAYLAGHAVGLLKALWLPTLLVIAATCAIMPSYLDQAIRVMGLGPNPDPNEALALVGPMMKSIGLLLLTFAVLYPMLIVGSLRHIVRGDEQKLPFYVGFGGDELRVLGAYVLMFIMVFISYLMFALVIGVVAGVLTLVSPIFGAVGGLVGFVGGLVALLWFVARISVTFPAAVATKSLGLAQSFRATKGNSIGLMIYWTAIGVMLLIVGSIYFGLFLGDAMPIYADMFKAGADEAAQHRASLKLLEWQRDLYDIGKPKFWPFAIGAYLYTMAMMAVVNVAAGIAWRYLTDRAAPDALPRQSALAA